MDEREAAAAIFSDGPPVGCWLAQFDPEERTCTETLERVHVISRQRVETLVWQSLRDAELEFEDGPIPFDRDGGATVKAVVLLAAWDPRNGRIGCNGHHPRFDSHSTPRIVVPARALPGHVLEFIEDYGLEAEAERKFPGLTFELQSAVRA